jgi:hypothetical protein
MQTDTHMPVFTVNNNQKGEVTQMSMIRWMAKQDVVYLINEILFILKKE